MICLIHGLTAVINLILIHYNYYSKHFFTKIQSYSDPQKRFYSKSGLLVIQDWGPLLFVINIYLCPLILKVLKIPKLQLFKAKKMYLNNSIFILHTFISVRFENILHIKKT